MNRQQKEAVVNDFKHLLTESKAVFLVKYKGLSVAKMQSLRRDLREQDGLLRVTKARLMKIAASGIDGIDDFKNDFKDQVGLVFAKNDMIPVAKALVEFSKKEGLLQVISGFDGTKLMDLSEIEYLASLPPKDILRAQLVATLQYPISGLVNTLNMMLAQLVYLLEKVAEKKK